MAESVQQTLKRLVVGQNQAIRALSRLIDMHFAWLDAPDSLHRPPNALVMGPTGTGKTHTIKVAAEALNIPCLVVDSTRLVSTGGARSLSPEDILQMLVKRARTLQGQSTPEEHATRGIIFLDEFDKLRFGKATEDTAAVQRRLLQFIEGDDIDLDPSEYQEPRVIDTRGILFIAAGAFTNIERYMAQRAVGYGSGESIKPEDVHRYGFIEELAARLPIIIRFNPLSVDALQQILLQEDVSPLTFYRRYFRRNGYELHVEPEVLLDIARIAGRSKLGARGLHQELFPLLNDLANQLMPFHPSGDGQRRFTMNATVYKRLKNGTYDYPRSQDNTAPDD